MALTTTVLRPSVSSSGNPSAPPGTGQEQDQTRSHHQQRCHHRATVATGCRQNCRRHHDRLTESEPDVFAIADLNTCGSDATSRCTVLSAGNPPIVTPTVLPAHTDAEPSNTASGNATTSANDGTGVVGGRWWWSFRSCLGVGCLGAGDVAVDVDDEVGVGGCVDADVAVGADFGEDGVGSDVVSVVVDVGGQGLFGAAGEHGEVAGA